MYMIFDCESVGLHGETFAVAWVVVDHEGKRIASAAYSCSPDAARGDEEWRTWARENVTLPPVGSKRTPREVRREFWEAWVYAETRGATLWADCCWPVEARFLLDCVDDDPESRQGQGPYPLHDIATLRLAAGLDPLVAEPRRPEENPAHNPQCDAIYSARLLLAAVAILGR